MKLEYFEPLVPGVRHISQPYCYRCPLGLKYPDCGVACAKELETVIEHEGPELVAALVVTAISHITPVTVPPPEYWPMIKAICEKYGVLLIDDEVICGFGRTGKMFAMENWGIVPDIMTMAKSFTGGYLPLSACTCTSEISEKFDEENSAFQHFSTFGGLPACCAAAQTNIEIIEREKLVEKTAAMGEYFSQQAEALYEHPTVGDIRGDWLDLVHRAGQGQGDQGADRRQGICEHVEGVPRRGVSPRCLGRKNRVLPPLVITRDEIDQCIAIMDKAIGNMEKELLAH